MVVIHNKPIVAEGSYMTPHQPVGPLLVLEYVSKTSVRKDEEVSYTKYEKELKVPYYLLFYPDADEFTLFKLKDGKYITVLPHAQGRCAIPELELEVGLLGKWMRYWFRNELVPLPDELLKQRDAAQQQRDAAQQQRDAAQQQRDAAQAQLDTERTARQAAEAEIAKLREELAKAKDKK